MEMKPFGRTGRSVSAIGIGTYYDTPWMFASLLGWNRGSARKLEAIRAGVASGVNLIDTAEAYRSEPLVREALRDAKREELFLATKVTPTHLRYGSVKKALERSLERLGTDYVDLYQIHFPNPVIPLKGTMKAMEELQEEGKIRAIGVSNFSLGQTRRANSLLKNARIACIQMEYSLAERRIEKELLPYCREEGIAVLAYRPLGHGRLSSAGTKLEAISRKHAKTPAQVALNWLCLQPGVFPIPRASSAAHVIEDTGGTGWALDDADLKDLDGLFPPPA